MELTTDKAKLIFDGGDWLCFRVRKYEGGKVIDEWNEGKEYTLNIAPKRKKRSLNANSYMWQLADGIAVAIGQTTAVEVYRRAIRDVGVFADIRIAKEAVPQWAENWQCGGIGRLCLIDKESYSEEDGMVTVRNYYGSSSYDTKQMSRLLDWIVEEAGELGIETMTPAELASIKGEWGK